MPPDGLDLLPLFNQSPTMFRLQIFSLVVILSSTLGPLLCRSRWSLKYEVFGCDVEFSWLARNMDVSVCYGKAYIL
jgi:hypothetical protein